MVDVQDKSAPVKLAPEIVRAVAKDPELRSLRPGSTEYQAAFTKKFGDKTDTTKTESAAVTETERTETKEVSDEKTTSNDDEGKTVSPRAEKRISKLTAEKKSLEARIAQLEAEGKTLKQAEKQAESEAPKTPTSQFDKPKPKADDFKTVSDYVEAVADWKADKRDFEKEQAAKAKTETESRNKSVSDFSEKGKKLEKEMNLEPGDFDIVVNDEGFKMFDTSRATILGSEFGPQIAFDIASDDALKEKFSQMTAIQQLTFIGKLEAKFEAKKQTSAETKTISSAKAPGKSIQKGVPSSGLTYKPGDFKSYEAMRKEQRPNKFKR